MSTTPSTGDRASAATGAATEEGKRVGGIAADEAKAVASEATQQVRGLVGEAQTHLSDQTGTQRDRLVEMLQSLSGDLQRMSEQSETSGIGSDLARQAAERARGLTERIDGREPADLLEDVRAFARRRPGTFVLGALAAGVVAGRLVRGAKTDTAPSTGDAYYADAGSDDALAGLSSDFSGLATSTEPGRPAPAYSAPYAADLADDPRTGMESPAVVGSGATMDEAAPGTSFPSQEERL